jgi:hypothetical protein
MDGTDAFDPDNFRCDPSSRPLTPEFKLFTKLLTKNELCLM